MKKRWGAIYEQVAERRPKLFRAASKDSLLKQQRGAEKRHRLLNYLRSQLEELRPVELLRPRARRRIANVQFTKAVSDY